MLNQLVFALFSCSFAWKARISYHLNISGGFCITFSKGIGHSWCQNSLVGVWKSSGKQKHFINEVSNLLKDIITLDISIVFFFLMQIECKKGRTSKMQPLWISKDPCITEEKGKLIKWGGGCVGVYAPGFESLKIISAGKVGGRERVPVPWSHGDKLLANEVVRHFSNLTAKECWELAKRVLRAKHPLGRIIDFNSSEHLPW